MDLMDSIPADVREELTSENFKTTTNAKKNESEKPGFVWNPNTVKGFVPPTPDEIMQYQKELETDSTFSPSSQTPSSNKIVIGPDLRNLPR